MDTTGIIEFLYSIGCFKTGRFVLKSGKESTYYIDLRNIISYPLYLQTIAKKIADKILLYEKHPENLVICGLPYGAIPLATLIAQILNAPLIMVRKERKEYGTGKQVEGLDRITPEQYIVFIDDIITTGSTINEYKNLFKKISPEIKFAPRSYVVIDREAQKQEMDITPIPLITLSDIKQVIKTFGVPPSPTIPPRPSFSKRAQLPDINPITRRLFETIVQKNSNLIVSIDETNIEKIIYLIEQVKSYVCAIKFHSDIWELTERSDKYISDFKNTISDLAKKYNFLIFEDRKFADIGAIVEKQIYSISRNYNELDIVTTLPIAGQGVLDAIKNKTHHVGVLIVCQLSNAGNLIDESYTKKCVDLGMLNSVTTGFICQRRVHDDNKYIYITPGVRIDETTKHDGRDQRYRTPTQAICRDGCDVIIVGRGITNSKNPGVTAQKYAKVSYNSYLKCTKNQ